MGKRFHWTFAVVLAGAVAGCLAKVPAAAPFPAAPEVARNLMVGFKAGTPPEHLQAGGAELTQTRTLSMGDPVGFYQMPSAAPVSAVLDALRRRPDVSWVQQDSVQRPSAWPDDPDLWLQWALGTTYLDPDPLWQRNIDASHVRVAVLDTGIDPYHPEFAGRLLMGLNALTGNTDSEDTDGHGTHVAGIIGAAGNNGIGVAGVCWQCQLLSVKVLDKHGGDDEEALQGIVYAVNNGAQVINMSFNSEATSPNNAYLRAIDYALSRNVVVVAAAGNDGGAVTQPANTPGLLAVAATTQANTLATYSNRGPQVGIAAPGDAIFSTLPGDNYGADTGTSMAAPFVAGAAAILRAEHPSWTAPQIIDALEGATDPVVSLTDPTLRIGRLDLSKLP